MDNSERKTIIFDWYIERWHNMSAELYPNGEVVWAVLIGDNSDCGTFMFDGELCPKFLKNLRSINV
jgi:hypothetical protein